MKKTKVAVASFVIVKKFVLDLWSWKSQVGALEPILWEVKVILGH